MKSLLVVAAALLAANLAWMVVQHQRATARSPSVQPQTTNSAEPKAGDRLSSSQMAVLKSGDVGELIAAGFPEDMARQLLAGRAYARMRERGKALHGTTDSSREFWKLDPNFRSNLMKKNREMTAINQHYAEELRMAFGDDADPFSVFDDRYSSLPPARRDLLRRIERDYSEMQSEIYAEMGGFPLPSDQEKLKLLEEEKRRDILAALTPREAEEFDLRSSQTAHNIRYLYGDGIKNEAEYRKIFALQKAFDDRYNNPFTRAAMDPAQQTAMIQAQQKDDRQLQEDMRRELGEEAYAAIQRAADQDLRTLKAVEQRLRLPAGTAEEVYGSRDSYAAQSGAINDDPGLSHVARREKLQALAQQAAADLQATLGAQGAELYSQRSRWIQMLKNGTAFSTDRKDAPVGSWIHGTTIFPLPTKSEPSSPGAPSAGR